MGIPYASATPATNSFVSSAVPVNGAGIAFGASKAAAGAPILSTIFKNCEYVVGGFP